MFCTYCGKQVKDVDAPCPFCGRRSPTAPEGVLGREGKVLVAPAGAEFPDYCVKCNAPAEGYRKMLKLSWHSPALLLLLLVGLLPGAIVILVLSKKAKLNVGLCARHRSAWSPLAIVGLVLLLAGVVAFAALIVTEANHNGGGRSPMDKALNAGACFIIPVAGFVGLVMLRLGLRRLTPKKIDERGTAWVKGVSEEFLDQHVGAKNCPACRYDLAGVPRGADGGVVCPECGKVMGTAEGAVSVG